MKYKISYLGYLGFFGLVSLFLGSFTHSVFLVFFLFFNYSSTVPDELFKENVKRSAIKAFVVNMILTTIASFMAFLSVGPDLPEILATIIIVTYHFIFMITVLTFVFNLRYLELKESVAIEKTWS